MKFKPSKSTAQNVSAVLPKVVEKYFKAGRAASDGKRSPKQLHKFRLRTKQFRYTLELFRPVYGDSLEKHLDTLHDLQSVLGKLSDHETVRQTFKGDKAIAAKLAESSKKKLKDFHERWAEFDAKGQLDRWKAFLGGGSPQRAKPSKKQRAKPSKKKT